MLKTIAIAMVISVVSGVAYAQTLAPASMSAEQYKAIQGEIDSYAADMKRLDAEERELYPQTLKARESNDTKRSCELAKSTTDILTQKIDRIDLAKSKLAPVGVDVSSMVPLRDVAQKNINIIKPFIAANCAT